MARPEFFVESGRALKHAHQWRVSHTEKNNTPSLSCFVSQFHILSGIAYIVFRPPRFLWEKDTEAASITLSAILKEYL